MKHGDRIALLVCDEELSHDMYANCASVVTKGRRAG
jgi:hypothetical protein